MRKLILKIFPVFNVPFLKVINISKNTGNKSKYSKQLKYLNLFINKLAQNESFKTSEVLSAFLSYEDKNKFENLVQEYIKKPQQNLKIEESVISKKTKKLSKILINISNYIVKF